MPLDRTPVTRHNVLWRRRRAAIVALVGIVTIAASPRLAVATDTSWLTARSGDFADRARWTAGVPRSTTTAILGATDSTDAFTVAFGQSATIGALSVNSQSPTFALNGHSLAMNGFAVSGSPALFPQLTLSGGTVTSVGASIGTQGNGHVLVRDGATFKATTIAFGVSSPNLGLLDVRGPGSTASIGLLPAAGVRLNIADGATVSMQTNSSNTTLSPNSSLQFELGANGSGRLLVAGVLILGGSLTLTLADGFVPAPGSMYLLVEAGAFNGAFASIDMPRANGIPISIVVVASYVIAVVANDATQFAIDPTPVDVFVGFTQPVSALVLYEGGAVIDATEDVPWSTADQSIATITSGGATGGVVTGIAPGVTTLTTNFGSLVASATLTTLAVPESLQIVRASEAADGTGGNESVEYTDELSSIALSEDGRFVAFASNASNLVADDIGGFTDIFRKDLTTGVIEQVSIAMDGTSPNDKSRQPAMSANGRFVAFKSFASNLVPDDGPNSDVFVRDLELNTTERIRAMPPPGSGFASGFGPRLSADGRYVAFIQDDYDIHHNYRAYRFDRSTGVSDLASATSSGMPATVPYLSSTLDISADGSIVSFCSMDVLVPEQPGGTLHVWIRDLVNGTLTAVSRTPDGTFGNANSAYPRLSGDGRLVAFKTGATNLAPIGGLLVWDRCTGAFEPANLNSRGEPANAFVYSPCMTRDGRFVVFESEATNLTGEPRSDSQQVFRRDRLTQTTDIVSLGPLGLSNGESIYGNTIADSGHVAFASYATNLSPYDLNNRRDVFVRAMSPWVFADLDGDNLVGSADLAILLGSWGSNNYFANLDKDGIVGAGDLGALLGAWSVP